MRQIALGIIVTGLITTSAWAQEPASARLVTDGALADVSFAASALAQAADEPEEKPFSLTVGLDVPTAYYWRGIAQNTNENGETEGFVAQPFVNLGLALSEQATLNVGVWTSLHSSEFTKTFYEADYYAGLAFTAGKWMPGVMYTAYTSPNDTFSTLHELALSIGYDDSESSLPLAPSALVGFFSDEAGTYFQAGISPSFPASETVSLSIPVGIGLGFDDFYGDKFGYFKAGVKLGVDMGSGLELHGGVDLMFLGESIRFDGDKVKPVGNIGFSYTY